MSRELPKSSWVATLKVHELRDLAREKGFKGYSRLTKPQLVLLLKDVERPSEWIREQKAAEKYLALGQLGRKGKEGLVQLVIDVETQRSYAKKQFSKGKSTETLRREVEFQQRAAEMGVAPPIVEVNYREKYIIMEALDRTLYDILKDQKGELKEAQQQAIVELFHKLDRAGVFHNDPTALNIMERRDRFYLIDYGFAKDTTHPSLAKYRHPNFDLLPLALLSGVKGKTPTRDWTYIRDQIPDHIYRQFGIAAWP